MTWEPKTNPDRLTLQVGPLYVIAGADGSWKIGRARNYWGWLAQGQEPTQAGAKLAAVIAACNLVDGWRAQLGDELEHCGAEVSDERTAGSADRCATCPANAECKRHAECARECVTGGW